MVVQTRYNNSLFLNYLDTLPDIVQSVDIKGKFIYTNIAWGDALGYSALEAKKLFFTDIISPEHQKSCKTIFNKIMSGKSVKVNTQFIGKNKKRFLVQGNINPLIKNNKIIGTVGVFRDLTSFGQMEKQMIKYHNTLIEKSGELEVLNLQLSESQKKYQLLLDMTNQMVISVDDQGKILFMNKVAATTFGGYPDDYIGRNLKDLFPLDIAEEYLHVINSNVENTDYTKEHCFDINLEYKYLRTSIKYLNSVSGHKTFLLLASDNTKERASEQIREDYTAQLQEKTAELELTNSKLKKTEEKIDQLNKSLERKIEERTIELRKKTENLRKSEASIKRLLAMKSMFLNQVAHDLRTPLTPIFALLPLLKESLTDKQSHQDLDIVIRNARYLNALLNDVLDISRIDAGAVKLSIEKIDISNIIDNSLSFYRTQILNENIIIKKNYDKKRIPAVQADPIKISEVVNNLLSNSIKFLPKKGIIRISISIEKEDIIVSLTDNGKGIIKKHINHIFDEFYKADESRHESGSGLGLAISKRIIELLHNGKIWVESKGRGKGSSFSFSLPIKRGAQYEEENTIARR